MSPLQMPSDIFIHLNDKIANKDNKTVKVVYNIKAKKMKAKKRENMVGVLPKRRTLMRHRKLQGNQDTMVYPITPDHNIQSMTQDMTQALRIGEHLSHTMDSDGCSPD
ncbi:Phosphoglycerate mutase-like protein AT74 [Glycine soja]